MKLLFFLNLFFLNVFCFAQKIQNKKPLFIQKHYIVTPLNFNSVGVYLRDFKLDTLKNSFKIFKPIKIYSISSIIFDIANIALLDKNKFLASYAGCTQKTISAGTYRIEKGKLILKSSKQIFKTIPKHRSIEELKYEFINIHEIKYLISNSGLKYLK
jgi:hypothetical protein